MRHTRERINTSASTSIVRRYDTMRLVNKTRFDTLQLRKLVSAICKSSGYDEPIVCVFDYSRNVCWHGLGSLGAKWIKIFVSRSVTRFTGVDCADLIIHELRHNTGLRHKDMHDNMDDMNLEYVNVMVVNERLEKPHVIVDIKQKRYERVIELIDSKERMQKRLHNSLKKLHKRKRYYEQVMKTEDSKE
jgi:hypothetical protein